MTEYIFEKKLQNLSKKKVKSSETIRNESSQSFLEWFAGLLDADGGFYISRQHHISCEITLHEKEIQTLHYIKSQLGGSINPRKNKKAYRWRLHKKKPIVELITRLNGKLQTQRVQKQFLNVCEIYGIRPLLPSPLDLDNAWFSGFFCGEGSFTINPSAKFQPSISCSQKEQAILEEIQKLFGGKMYYDPSWNGWIWWVDARSIKLSFYNYCTNYSFHNPPKQARLKSLLRFCKYLERGLHKDPNSQGRLLHFVKVFRNDGIKIESTFK